MGPSWAVLGPFWARLGASLGPQRVRLDIAGLGRNALFAVYIHLDFILHPSSANFANLRRFGAILGPSWAILGRLGAVLGPLGADLGPSWGVLGPSCAILGPSWGCLGAVLGPLGADLGPSLGVLGPSCAILGLSWAILGRLGAIWGVLGTSRGRSWAIFGRLGAILGHLGAVLGHLGASWGHLVGLFLRILLFNSLSHLPFQCFCRASATKCLVTAVNKMIKETKHNKGPHIDLPDHLLVIKELWAQAVSERNDFFRVFMVSDAESSRARNCFVV